MLSCGVVWLLVNPNLYIVGTLATETQHLFCCYCCLAVLWGILRLGGKRNWGKSPWLTVGLLVLIVFDSVWMAKCQVFGMNYLAFYQGLGSYSNCCTLSSSTCIWNQVSGEFAFYGYNLLLLANLEWKFLSMVPMVSLLLYRILWLTNGTDEMSVLWTISTLHPPFFTGIKHEGPVGFKFGWR